jgi:hypothetical protein
LYFDFDFLRKITSSYRLFRHECRSVLVLQLLRHSGVAVTHLANSCKVLDLGFQQSELLLRR